MPRRLSASTLLVYQYLWYLPWACAADIARFKDLPAPAVKNVLARGEKKGWLVSARLGRVHDAVDRYVFTNAGVEKFEAEQEWPRFWWHTANGVRALARRIEVVEMAYLYLPQLWQSNIRSKPTAYVFRETADTAWLTGEPVMRASLVESDWSGGRLLRIYWLQSGPFEAVVAYSNGNSDDGILLLPLLWRGNFQKVGGIASVRRNMERVFELDERWSTLPMNQAVYGDYYPGAVAFCPDRVATAMLQRHWLESSTEKEHFATLAIVDAQGQVVRSMRPPTSWWQRFTLPPRGGSLGNIARAVELLGTGSYAAVNGRRAWRTFRAVDGSPGVTAPQIAASVGVSVGVARSLLAPMVSSDVLTVRAGGHYLDESGRKLLADSQRVTSTRVHKRWGVYSKKGGEYSRGQRIHNQGQAGAILLLRQHGFPAFPAMGVVIDYYYRRSLIRVVPDAFVVLPPGVLVAVEYERSATSYQDLKDKADKYKRLADIGCPLPVLFITEPVEKEPESPQQMEAAEILCRFRYPFLLSATLEQVKQGPHGTWAGQHGTRGTHSGCWWHWYDDEPAPSRDAPIDLWSHIYAENSENSAWRVPVDNQFSAI